MSSGKIKSNEKKIAQNDDSKRPRRESTRSSRYTAMYFMEEKTTVKKKSPTKNKSPSRKSPARNKSPTRNKSPAKAKSPARTKSPARNKSPSRNKSLSQKKTEELVKESKEKVQVKTPRQSPRKSSTRKSPARKSPSRRSPGRKSPSRLSPARLHVESNIKHSTTMHTSTPILDIDSDSDNKFKPLKLSVRNRISRSREKSTAKFYDLSNYLLNVQDSERVVHLKKSDIFTPQEKNLTEFSDDDENFQVNKCIDSIEPRQYHTVFVTEFGGWFGAVFFIIMMPSIILGLQILCNNKQCTFQLPDLSSYKISSTYINAHIFLGFAAYNIVLMILTILPIGGKIVHGGLNKYGRSSYVVNGWISVLVMHILLLGSELYGISFINYIYNKYFAITVTALLFGIIASVCMYIRSFFVPVSALNPNGDTNSVVYNFFMGREVNPNILDILNIKIYFLRLANVTMVLITTIILFKSLNLKALFTMNKIDFSELNFDVTCLTLGLMWYIFVLDGIFFEKTWSTTFEMQYEGIGYMSCVSYFTYPFTYGTIMKYVYEYGIKMNKYLLTLAFIQFIIGYIIYRGSNNQKDTFRKNPYSPSVAHLDSLLATQGKKLIVSGFWGRVRHPNYLGNILMHLSFLYFVPNCPPALVCLMVIPVLMYRAKRDGFRCKQKYEIAWYKYCQRVKYILIPKIY